MHRPGFMSPVNSREISGGSVGPGVSVAVAEVAVGAAGQVGVAVAAGAVEVGDGAGAGGVEVCSVTGTVGPAERGPHPVTASTASPSHSLNGRLAGLFDGPRPNNKRNFDCEVLDNSDVLRYYF